MSTQAQYASIPKLGRVTISTANPARDGTGTMGVLVTATPTANSGTRVDKIQATAQSDTTAGMLRLFLVKGSAGAPVSSINFSTTTATVVTTVNHGLVTGDLATVQGATPDQYNVTNAAVTVINATSFSYTMPVAPSANAVNVGGYSTIKAAEVPSLWREIPVTAAVVAPRAISSISFVTTTATMTTATPHGLTTGDTIVVAGATPAQYNGTFAVTVTGTNTLTYTMASAPATNASVVGAYSVAKQAFNVSLCSQFAPDVGYLPLNLPSGYQVRVSTNNAETFNVSHTSSGDYA